MFTALFDIARADVAVVLGECRHHIVEAQTIGDQLAGVGGDVELLEVAANSVDLGDAWNIAQLRTHNPVLNGAHIGRVIQSAIRFFSPFLGLDGPHEDLAQSGGNRPHRRLDTRWQLALYLLYALVDQLPCKIDISTILENDRDLRQPIAGERTCLLKKGQTCHRRFDRKGDALLGFQR